MPIFQCGLPFCLVHVCDKLLLFAPFGASKCLLDVNFGLKLCLHVRCMLVDGEEAIKCHLKNFDFLTVRTSSPFMCMLRFSLTL